MILANFFFYVFSALVVIASLMVISVRNPVHSVLFLILTFFASAGIFIILGAEFVSMALVIVYVGAVAVLFLFVVMMLNVNFVKLKEGFIQNLPMVIVIAAFFLFELIMVIKASKLQDKIFSNVQNVMNSELTNTHELGEIIYTKYFIIFQLAGLVLFVAMVSAIILTLRKDKIVRRQNIANQLDRDPRKSVRFVQVETGSGIEVSDD